jgi:hypothetical protein
VSESVEGYWQRKNAELALLAEHANIAAITVADAAALQREKLRLRALLFANGATESRIGGAPERFAYTYQRFDLRVRTRRWLEAVYAVDGRGGLSVGLYAGSGMGVISASLRAIDGWLKSPRRLLVPPDLYFETRKLLPRLQQLLPSGLEDELNVGDLYYLDSVTDADHFSDFARRPIELLQLVLFDTTCYDAGSPRIARAIERCAEARVPLLLLRSHMKLDQLGCEHARLGSAVLWLPPRPSRTLVKLARALRLAIFEELTLAGAMATPASFWPLEGAKLRELTARRVERMVAAQKRAAAGLRERGVEIVEPHHGCFLWLFPRTRPLFAAHELRRDLVSRLRAAGIDAATASSFGYDFTALTSLALPAGPAIRIAIADLPDVEVDRIVEIVAVELISARRTP